MSGLSTNHTNHTNGSREAAEVEGDPNVFVWFVWFVDRSYSSAIALTASSRSSRLRILPEAVRGRGALAKRK